MTKKRKVRSLDLAFVGGAPFKHLAKQKNFEVFSISICNIDERLDSLHGLEVTTVSTNNISLQMSKTDKLPTDPRTVVPEDYYDFLDVFSRKASDTVAAHSKYNNRIWLLENYKSLGHSLLLRMSQEQCEFVKKFLKDNLKKKFIEASSLPYLSPILLTKKPRSGIKFCVDYQ